MLCRMPAVGLPPDLAKELERSGSGTIDGTQGPGVASYLSSDGEVRADVYLGVVMDGFNLYQNISSLDPDIKMQFAQKPDIICHPDVILFNPDNNNTITIQV